MIPCCDALAHLWRMTAQHCWVCRTETAASKFKKTKKSKMISTFQASSRSRGARERYHVPNTFKAQGDHFHGLREPFSQPKFDPLHSPANRTAVRKKNEEQGNEYGRHCTLNLHRALPRPSPDVAGLFSARYLMAAPCEVRDLSYAGTERRRASLPTLPSSASGSSSRGNWYCLL